MNRPHDHLLASRVLRHWRLKLTLGAALTLLFCAGYFGLQRVHLGQARVLPLSIVDRAIAYEPAWAIVYQSMYLMLPLAWLAESREQLRQYGLGFALTACAGFAFFFFYPVIGPRPATLPTGLLRFIHSYDSPLNSFPSLHMALATHVACFGVAVMGAKPWLVIGLVVWVMLIAYATLATKQHYFVDVPAGIALGAFGHWIAVRVMRPHALRSIPYFTGAKA